MGMVGMLKSLKGSKIQIVDINLTFLSVRSTKIHPVVSKVRIGDYTKFSCQYEHPIAMWLFKRYDSNNIQELTFGDELTVGPVTIENGGNYYCYTKYHSGKPFLSQATLYILGEPSLFLLDLNAIYDINVQCLRRIFCVCLLQMILK